MKPNPKYEINGFSLENIRNRYEVRVIDKMRKILPTRDDFCGCRICVEDVYAAALNQLPPHYVQNGTMVLRSTPPTDAEFERAVDFGLEQVIAHPNHSVARKA